MNPVLANNPDDIPNVQGVQQELINLRRHLARVEATMEAMNANTYILSQNRRRADPRPRQKYTEGNGHDLALAICGPSCAALPAAVQDFQPNAAIGDVPKPWNPLIEGYEDLDILKLVIFYNDSFGIVAGDSISDRRFKVRYWLSEGIRV